MKRWIGILLLCCLFLPLCGGLAIFHFQKNIIRKNIKNQIITGIDSSRLTLLKFSFKEIDSKIHWEDDKEFEYQGEMFDIVYIKTKQDSIWYWCWKDIEETHLKKEINQLFSGALNQDETTQNTKKLLAEFWKYTCLLISEEDLSKKNSMLYFQPIAYYCRHFRNPSLQKITPPPQLFTA